MQSLQIFNNGVWNVKTHVCNEVPYFNGKDVATALGYTNQRKAIRDHVFEEDRPKLQDLGGNVAFLHPKEDQGHSVYITETGVWALVFGSKKEEAKQFKKWVCSEVLPKLRKQYQEQMRAPLNLRNESDLHQKVVQAIRRFWPDALLIAGLGELQDTAEKRMKAYRCGYQAGQPDIMLLNHHCKYNGFALELKNPKGCGKLSEKQFNLLESYRAAGFLTLASDEYDIILHELIKYFENIRIICEFCGRKFKTVQTLQIHCNKFHKCC